MDAVAVAHQSGDLTVNPDWSRECDERLHRAADGSYYLYRKDSGREYVHRLSLQAAVLWSVVRANISNPGLRRDVNALFDLDRPRPLGTRKGGEAA